MKLFLDSANISEIEPLLKTGIFLGVTTNPVILQKDRKNMKDLPSLAEKILSLNVHEVFFQTWGCDSSKLVAHGLMLASIDRRVVVKCPATKDGVTAATYLADKDIKVCITAVYNPAQALLANACGASYVAPYLGRMNDSGMDGHANITQMVDALKTTKHTCEVLAASIRSIDDLITLAQNGVTSATFSTKVANDLFAVPMTIEATHNFEKIASQIS